MQYKPVYPYDFAVIFTGKIWNYGNYGQKIIFREKKIEKNPHKVSSATISVKRQTAKKAFSGMPCVLHFYKDGDDTDSCADDDSEN